MKNIRRIIFFIIFLSVPIFVLAYDAFLQYPLGSYKKITQYPRDNYTISHGLPYYDTHTGTDYDIEKGSNIYTAADGEVIKAVDGMPNGCEMASYERVNYGYGNYVEIKHDNGLYSLYGHMSKGGVKVSVGDRVRAGDVIGLVGNSGWSEGSDECGTFIHLHFEIREKNYYGNYINPYNLDTGCLFLGGCNNPQLPSQNSSNSPNNNSNASNDSNVTNNSNISNTTTPFSLNHIGWLDAHSNEPRATHLSSGNFGGSVEGLHLATDAQDQDVYFYGEWNGHQIHEDSAVNQLSRIEGKGRKIQDMASGKFEGGNKEYLAVIYQGSDLVYFYYNNQLVGALDTHGGRPQVSQITAGDVDHDGREELFVATTADDHIYMFDSWHEKSIGFTMNKVEHNFLDAHDGNPAISALVCMDIDDNGYDELMVATNGDDHIYEYFYTNKKNWLGQIEEVNFNKQGYTDGVSGGFVKEMVRGEFKGNDGVRDYLAVLSSGYQNRVYFYWERDLDNAWGGLLSEEGYITAPDGNSLSDIAASDINPNSEGEELILASEDNDHLNFFGERVGDKGGSGSEEGIFDAKIVSQSGKKILMKPGEVKELWIEYENTGQATWFPDRNNSPNLITADPNKRNSIFSTNNWTNQWQPGVLFREVAPGEKIKFKFKIKAPNYSKKFQESFTLYNGQEDNLSRNSEVNYKIIVDGEKPTKVKNLRGDNKKTIWQESITKDQTPSFKWDRASDKYSGIDGYYAAIDDATPDGGGKYDNFIGNKLVWTTPKLNEGWHTVAVTSKDKAGNINPENTNKLGDAPYLKFLIDKTPPSQVINFRADESENKWVSTGVKSLAGGNIVKATNTSLPKFIWQKAHDNLSGIGGYYIAIDDNDPNGQGDLDYRIKNKNYFIMPKNLLEGEHTIYIRPFDKAGNIAKNIISYTFVVDKSAPEGSVIINNDDKYTNNTNIGLDIQASDLSPIIEYRVSNNAKNWKTYSVSSVLNLSSDNSWQLEAIDGTRTIYVQFRDALGHLSNIYYDSIYLDMESPDSFVNDLPTWFNTLEFLVSWQGSDNLSGVKWYDVQYKDSEENQWIDWLKATTITSKIFQGVDGLTYYFRSRAEDIAGNIEEYRDDPDTAATIDITVPDTPVIIYPERNAGFNNSLDENELLDGVQATFNGTAEVGSRINLLNLSNNQSYSTITDQEGNWVVSDVSLKEGENIIEATVFDAAGNSNTSGEYKYFIDTVAPASISDLEISHTTYRSLNIEWTAPGDDDNGGTASEYDIRYSASEITAVNFDSATQIETPSLPEIAGTHQSFLLDNLDSKETYYVAIKTSDEVLNWSGISNIVNGYTTTSADTITLSTSNNTVMAEGIQTVNLEAKVLDHEGNSGAKLSGEPVIISMTDNNGVPSETGSISAVIDQGDGTYTAIYTSATKVGDGQIEITASDPDCATTTSSPQNINLIPGNPFGTINLNADPASLDADGSSMSTIASDIIYDRTGNMVADDQEITISTDLGTITTPDQNAVRPGIQLLTHDGQIELQLKSSRWNGYGEGSIQAAVEASSILGSAAGSVNVSFEDVEAPSAPHVSTPSNGLITNNNRPTIVGTAEKNSRVLIERKQGSDSWRYHYYTNADNSGNFSYRFGSGLADGNWSFRARARDAAGNTSGYSNITSIQIDTSNPVITGQGPVGTFYHRTNTIWANYSDSGSGIDTGQMRLRINGVVKSPTSITGGRVEFSNTFPDENGTYNVELTIYDRAGNSAVQNWSFNIQIASYYHSQIDGTYKTSVIPDWPYTNGIIPAPNWWDLGFNDSGWSNMVYSANLPPNSVFSPCAECQWLWGDSHVDSNETTIFRKRFNIPSGVTITGAAIRMSADNEAWGYVGYLNGHYFGKVPEAGSGDNPYTFGLASFLHTGENLLAVQTSNGNDNRAGFAYTMTVRYHD